MLIYGLLIVFMIIVMGLISVRIAQQAVMEKIEIQLKEKAVDVAKQIDLAIERDIRHL